MEALPLLGPLLARKPRGWQMCKQGCRDGANIRHLPMLLCSGVPVFSTSPSGQLNNGFRNILLHLTVLLVVLGRKVSLRVNCMSYRSAAVLKYHDERPLKGPRVFMAYISRVQSPLWWGRHGMILDTGS